MKEHVEVYREITTFSQARKFIKKNYSKTIKEPIVILGFCEENGIRFPNLFQDHKNSADSTVFYSSSSFDLKKERKYFVFYNDFVYEDAFYARGKILIPAGNPMLVKDYWDGRYIHGEAGQPEKLVLEGGVTIPNASKIGFFRKNVTKEEEVEMWQFIAELYRDRFYTIIHISGLPNVKKKFDEYKSKDFLNR